MITEDNFIWFIIVPFVGISLWRLLGPKRGPQHSYHNKMNSRIVLFLLVVGVVATGFFILLLQFDLSEALVITALTGGMIVFLIATYIWGHRMGPPTQGKHWLRKNYPKVDQAVQRYIKPREVREPIIPALNIHGKRYFLVGIYAPGLLEELGAYLLLDESGNLIHDRSLFEAAFTCKSLANETIEYHRHTKRAQEIKNNQRAIGSVRKVWRILRANKNRIASHSNQAAHDLRVVLENEGAAISIFENYIALKMLEARWAVAHGLGRLTEVNYADVQEFERRVRQSRMLHLPKSQAIVPAIKPMQRIADVVREMTGIKKSVLVLTVLEEMASTSVGLENETEAYDYAMPDEEHNLRSWRARLEYATEVDRLTLEGVPAA